jgi:hypothetical protein
MEVMEPCETSIPGMENMGMDVSQGLMIAMRKQNKNKQQQRTTAPVPHK